MGFTFLTTCCILGRHWLNYAALKFLVKKMNRFLFFKMKIILKNGGIFPLLFNARGGRAIFVYSPRKIIGWKSSHRIKFNRVKRGSTAKNIRVKKRSHPIKFNTVKIRFTAKNLPSDQRITTSQAFLFSKKQNISLVFRKKFLSRTITKGLTAILRPFLESTCCQKKIFL